MFEKCLKRFLIVSKFVHLKNARGSCFCFARHPKARRLQSTTAAARHYDMGGPGVNAILFFWRGSSSRTSFLFFRGAHVVVVTSPLSRCDQIKSANGRFGSVRFGSLRHRFGSHGSLSFPGPVLMVRFGNDTNRQKRTSGNERDSLGLRDLGCIPAGGPPPPPAPP